MGDEQTILLGPEEELTSVRERLERTPARRITLVIPAQTQLRSHVGWRLIHARMRELGKELLVISPDRQVRAVARAAGFQVAETQQEAASNRPRLGGGTRPGGINTRGAGRSRIGSSRGGPESHAPQQPGTRRRLSSNISNRPGTRPSAPSRPNYEEEEATFERVRRREAEASQHSHSAPTPLFEEPEDNPGQAYNFSIRATPAGRPSASQRDEDDDEEFKNTYEADYKTAQDILKAAREGEPASSPPPGNRRQRESYGASQFEEVEEGVPDIADRSTEIMESEIEDLGDMGRIDLPEIRENPASGAPGERRRERGGQPRSGSGQLQPGPRRSPRDPRPAPAGFDEDDDLLAMPERPVHGASASPRPSRGLGQGQRPSQSLHPVKGQRASQSLNPRGSQPLDLRASQRPSQAFTPGQEGRRGSRPLDPRAGGSRGSQPLDPRAGLRGSQPLDLRAGQRPSQTLSPGARPHGSQPSRTASRGSTGQQSPNRPLMPIATS
ncbi:MAG: hypothetical protein ACRDHW_03920, partial [Ktedonobacteraceae bacterium]